MQPLAPPARLRRRPWLCLNFGLWLRRKRVGAGRLRLGRPRFRFLGAIELERRRPPRFARDRRRRRRRDGPRRGVGRTQGACGFGDSPPSEASASSMGNSLPACTSRTSPISRWKRGCSEDCMSLKTSSVRAQVARQVLFGKLRRDLAPCVAVARAMRRSGACRRRRFAPPADCGDIAPTPGRSAAGCWPPRSSSSTTSSMRRESLSANAWLTRSNDSSEKAPSSARTSAAFSFAPQQAMAWSSAESESRTLPSPACARTASASGSASMPSCRRSTPCAPPGRRNPPSGN